MNICIGYNRLVCSQCDRVEDLTAMMFGYPRIYFYALLCTIINLFPARASYNLNVEVLSYASTTHVKSDGFCCRTPINLVCTDHCNNRFTFCVRPTGVNTSDSTGACLDSAQQLATGSISDDMMEFEIGRNLDAGIPNPLVFTADRWPGSVDFFVRVTDAGLQNNQNDLVAQFVIPINLNPASNNSKPGVAYPSISNLGQFIRLAFRLSCAENFYGDDCTRSCVGRNDDVGHYTCDSNGDVVCLEGFQEESTNCMQCTLAAKCSPVSAYCNSTDSCVCRDEFTGPNCAFIKDFCGIFSPCHNGAICMDTELEDGSTDYMCSCPDGYEGKNCSREIVETGTVGECLSSPCINGGTCTETAEGYECQCHGGFEGTKCELKSMPVYMGPFIGAAIAMGLLLITIVIMAVVLMYTFWQMKYGPQRKHRDNAAGSTRSATRSQTESTAMSPSNYEFDDGEGGGASETVLTPLEAGNDLRKNSETFDNPIYDQPTPPRSKKVFSASSERKLSSLSSLRSLSISSSQDYPPHSARTMENVFRNDPALHKYEDVILSGSEECLNATFKVNGSPRGSIQQIARADTETVDKLTVINETYDPLPCHLSSSDCMSFQGSNAASCSGGETRVLAYRPIVPEVVSAEVFSKEPVPNGHSLPKYPEGFHGNSLRLEIESCEQ